MRSSLLARPALAALLLAGSLGLAHADDLRRSISINGEASVSAKPDVAYVSIGVENAGKAANEVLAANSKTTGDVLAALKGAGIDAKDLQTSGFTVQPQILRPQNSSLSSSDDSPSITGYTVANTVNVTLHDLPKLGDVLDKAVTAGANSIDGIQFEDAGVFGLFLLAGRRCCRHHLARAFGDIPFPTRCGRAYGLLRRTGLPCRLPLRRRFYAVCDCCFLRACCFGAGGTARGFFAAGFLGCCHSLLLDKT